MHIPFIFIIYLLFAVGEGQRLQACHRVCGRSEYNMQIDFILSHVMKVMSSGLAANQSKSSLRFHKLPKARHFLKKVII